MQQNSDRSVLNLLEKGLREIPEYAEMLELIELTPNLLSNIFERYEELFVEMSLLDSEDLLIAKNISQSILESGKLFSASRKRLIDIHLELGKDYKSFILQTISILKNASNAEALSSLEMLLKRA